MNEAAMAGGALTVFLRLNKVLDPKIVDSPAVWFRHHHPQLQLVELGALGGKTHRDAPRLGPILLERRGKQRVVSLADPQFHAAVVLMLALWAEFDEPALHLELQLHDDVVASKPRRRSDFHAQFFGLLLGDRDVKREGEARAGSDEQNCQDCDSE